MIWKILITGLLWLIYIASAFSILVVIGFFLKFVVWDNIKKLFKKKQDKEILEKNPFEEKNGK